MEQTKPLSRTPVTGAFQKSSAQTTQPVVAQRQPTQEQPTRKPLLDVPKQPVSVQTQPAGQIQPEVETSIWKKWWLWLIIALAVIGAGVGIYFWKF